MRMLDSQAVWMLECWTAWILDRFVWSHKSFCKISVEAFAPASCWGAGCHLLPHLEGRCPLIALFHCETLPLQLALKSAACFFLRLPLENFKKGDILSRWVHFWLVCTVRVDVDGGPTSSRLRERWNYQSPLLRQKQRRQVAKSREASLLGVKRLLQN